MECPFRECGRKFVSDAELKNHMQRRHRPVAQPESSALTPQETAIVTAETDASSLQSTPVPVKSKAVVKSSNGGTDPSKDSASQHNFPGAKPKVVM